MTSLTSLIASKVQQVPVEIMQEIFSYIPLQELLMNFTRVCKAWQDAANKSVQKLHIKGDLPVHKILPK